jgi:hypothetical protein
MNTKAPAIGFIVATLLAAASPAISQDAPPLSEQAKQTEALVREGTNVTGQKDAKGKLFYNVIIKTAKTKGSGWVDYMFPVTAQVRRNDSGFSRCEGSIFLDAGLAFRFKDS